jgi:hypothetical protein
MLASTAGRSVVDERLLGGYERIRCGDEGKRPSWGGKLLASIRAAAELRGEGER